jgi:hypothetical protein
MDDLRVKAGGSYISSLLKDVNIIIDIRSYMYVYLMPGMRFHACPGQSMVIVTFEQNCPAFALK